MKVCYASDLHIEFDDNDDVLQLEGEGDVLVLAGDIAPANVIPKVLKRLGGPFRHTVFVPGNHEYYGFEYAQANAMMKSAETDSIHVLLGEQLDIDGLKVFGATLWSQISEVAASCMNDYRYIRHDGRKIAPFQTRQFNIKESTLLCAADADLYVTHHSPHSGTVEGKYLYRDNSAYVNDLPLNPGVYIHGHQHSPVSVITPTFRVMANPRGYFAYETLSTTHELKTVDIS